MQLICWTRTEYTTGTVQVVQRNNIAQNKSSSRTENVPVQNIVLVPFLHDALKLVDKERMLCDGMRARTTEKFIAFIYSWRAYDSILAT